MTAERAEQEESIFRFSNEQSKALAEKAKEAGQEIIICQIRPKSITQQLIEDAQYFGYVNAAQDLRSLVVPVSFEAAAFVDKKTKRGVPIPKSNERALDRQKEMIEGEFDQDLKVPGVKAIMAHAYVDTQLDIEHQKRIGKKLLVGFHARTPDETFGSRVADVGPDGLLRVCVWRRDCALGGVFAFPVVVPANLEI